MKIATSDCQLFAINKREPIRISWHGNEESFTHNKRHILNALGNGILSWKRESKLQSLPFNLRFTPSLVPFNADTSICSNPRSSNDTSTNSEFAFVHIFFVNSGNFEEYRLTVRPEISEWFATLNEAKENHWAILFDSSKVSKDKKAKSQLMDKLKSDFSRFQNRIFEFVELANEKSFAAFSVFLQSLLFASFELRISNLNANALKLKGSLKESSFGIHSLVNEQFRLCRFYWNLGLFEVALSELDALANLLSDSIKIWSANENAEAWPQWVRQLRLLPLGRHCTLLGVQMYLNTVEEELPLVKIHAHLLAHQFLLSAQNLHNRLSLASVPSPIVRSLSQPLSPQTKPKIVEKVLAEGDKSELETEQGQKEQQLNTLQLRHNTVTEVLRYARETIRRFEQHMLLLRANQSVVMFHCLLLVWLAELFKFSEHLLGGGKASKLCDVSSAAAHLNFLLLKKCEAIRHLSTALLSGCSSSDHSSSKQCLMMLRRWFDATSPNVSSDGTKSLFSLRPNWHLLPFSGPSSTGELQQRQHLALADESVRLFRDFSQMICEAIDGGEGTKAFEHFAKFALFEAVESFERFGWWRNAFLARHQLAQLTIVSSPSDAHALFRHNLCAFLSHPLNGPFAQNILGNLVKQFEETAEEKGANFKTILFGCCLAVLSMIDQSENNEIEIGRWHSKMSELTREMSHWVPKKIEVNGYFFLDSIFVSNGEFGVEFVLNYQEEMAKNAKLENLFCYVVGIRPNIQMKCIDSTEKESSFGGAEVGHSLFVSGIEQRFSVFVSPGTASLTAPSLLKLSLVQSSDGSIEFLNSDGNWAIEAQFLIPPLDVEEKHRILVRMCKGIDRLETYKPEQKNEGQSEEKCELKFEWFAASHCKTSLSDDFLIVRRSFPITFRPIMLLSWRTSFLSDRTLFHVDISRKDCVSSAFAVDVLPTFVSLLSLKTDCELLNPSPFKPIVPNSIFRFIWRLPEQSTDNSDAIPHFLQFKYRILSKKCEESAAGELKRWDESDREHSLSHRIDFPLQKIDYELCARFFSEQSQSVLCRVDQPTDLVVSLRSLSKTLSEAETIIVSIESDNDSTSAESFWHCAERHKLARVRENGVGQAIFTVVPRQLGFLPFPSIALHRSNSVDQSPSRNSSLLSEKYFGECLSVFYRNLTSQIHIIGPLHGISEETASISSANTTESAEPKKKSLKTVAKDRLQKLFE
ncbi:hypothetical protein niasHT_022637 [Heterodera trifolii]|uniref:TRAPPC10/Trs130 N-terminal domain-containing protein n=1 Tax=Heterodera trifolii TaxID=157864 RepID=A0ABD2JRI2_9BILA